MKNQFFLFCSLILFFAFSNIGTVKAQDANEPYVILVEYTINENDIDKVVDLLTEIQLETLENEEGCLVYDVLLAEDDPTKIFIYESYENEAAFKAHTNSAHFKQIVPTKLKPLIKQEKITKLFPLNYEADFSE